VGDDRWDPVAATFVDHYDSLYGQVRTHVLHAHLVAHLPDRPCDVVDVGGGAGNQSIPLARLGHRVTIVDPSKPMLAAAAEIVGRAPPEVANRVRLVEADGEAAPELLGARGFDAVLCHGVLMYLDDPEPLVVALAELARPGALVSVVTKNRQAMAVRPGLAGEWAEALAAFDAVREVNGLDLETRADDPEELAELLNRHAIEPVARYGVRHFTEGWARGRPPTDSVDDVLAVELEASRRDPYRQLSRLFHLVGRSR
jgi:2-polyprenyl-3-methyl-5-hydroxy-6-metoxy-1,4-benzoquinol methylase